MGLDLSPQPKQSPQPTISQGMQRSLEILQLSKTELIQKVYQELDSNPTLEIIEESTNDDPIIDIPGLKSELVSSESPSAADPDEEEFGLFEF